MKLTQRQQRFVDEYLLDLNGGQAAIRAGYSVNGADQQASELLRIDKVKAAVDRAIAHRANRIGVKQDEVVLELKRIGLADPAAAFDQDGNLLELSQMPEDIRRAISSFEVEERTTEEGMTRTVRRIRFWSKVDALDKLARHLGMLVDRTEVEHKGGFHLSVTVAPPRARQDDAPAGRVVVDMEDELSGSANSAALEPLATNGRGW